MASTTITTHAAYTPVTNGVNGNHTCSRDTVYGVNVNKNGNAQAVDDEFIRTAISKANLNALRLALLQVTGDPDLAKMKTKRYAIRGGAMFAHVLADDEAPLLKERAFSYLSARVNAPDQTVPAPPLKENTKALMDLFGDEPVREDEFDYDYEELAFEEFPRSAQWTNGRPADDQVAAFKVVVIGAGISGIGAGVQFQRLGLNFEILERQGGLGGTWLLNSYPEARVDTSSHLFQFKFVKNYPWTEHFATAGETRRYLERVADDYGVTPHCKFHREVVRAVWHDDASEWELTVQHSPKDDTLNEPTMETIRCNAVVSGSGLFATPNQEPPIPGFHDFKRPVFHTARWQHDVDYRGKRVALIGTGSTGTQLAAAVAREAKSLAVFQRTPNWIMNLEGYRNVVDDPTRWLFDHMPYYWNWHCYASHVAAQQLQGLQPYDREWQAQGGKISKRNDAVRAALTEYVTSKAEGVPGLLEKILPTYPPMVRRLVVDNGFYDMLRRDNVELVTDRIQKFTASGIRTADGVERELDMVILGTGFKTSEYFWPCEYVGRNGVRMQDLWQKDGARSYLGLVQPGFPNFFSFYGPNHQPRSGGFYSWAEIWARYTATCIVRLIEKGEKSIECRQDVFDEYQPRLDAAAKELIWEEPGHSYYVNKWGRSSVNVPFPTAEYHRMVSQPCWDDFHIR